MRSDDLFEIVPRDDPWALPDIRHDLLNKALKGPLEDIGDLELADVLVRLTHQEGAVQKCGGNTIQR